MTQGKRAWVYAGGDFSCSDIPSGEHAVDDLHVCVDSGVEHCLQAGHQPGFLIGDLDSVKPVILQDKRLVNVPRQVHSSRKASSDLELALQWLAEDPPDTVILLGVSGGRTDHMLFNWSLPLLRDWPFKLQLIDSTTRAYLISNKDSVSISAELGQIVSLLVLSAACGVSTRGLHYALSNATMLPGSTLGLSNEVVGDEFSVAIESGKILVMVLTVQ